MREQFEQVKAASRRLALMSDDKKNDILLAIADELERQTSHIVEENAKDLLRMDAKNPLYDRLKLTPERIASMATDMRHVATLPSPLGRTLKERTLPNGLHLRRVSVPFGVVGIIYEARPNVTTDVFSLCLKSGNACLLKGGHDAERSNIALSSICREQLRQHDADPDTVVLLPSTHEATAEMLNAVGYVDVCIPRGGRRLIDFVRDTARVPVIETGAGVVNTYFDLDGDPDMGRDIVVNAKTRRVSVCNALDCLIIHSGRIDALPAICQPLARKNVIIYADERAYDSLSRSNYPEELLKHATAESYGTEFMDYKMAVKVVDTLDEALAHIARYGSGHSEAIVTSNKLTARRFQQEADAACVYWNAPTSFTDGAQFGMGAEIGISTQKLGPRGPMALEEMTTYKWLIDGNGQTRPA